MIFKTFHDNLIQYKTNIKCVQSNVGELHPWVYRRILNKMGQISTGDNNLNKSAAEMKTYIYLLFRKCTL